ncbi:MAG: hypothetical protein ABR552_04625 [Actinomycetota bacterium]
MKSKFRYNGRVLLAFALTAVILPFAPARAGNLIPNAGFEQSYLPQQAIDAQRTAGIKPQPVWPKNWIAEGATELFDHTPNAHHSGVWAAGISGSWGVPRSDCSVQCTTVPGGPQRDQVYGSFYTEAPAWRTDLPIPVVEKHTYTLSYYYQLSIVMDGSGPVTWVRWYDANHAPLIDPATHLPAYTKGPSVVVDCSTTTHTSSYVTFATGDAMLDDCHSSGGSWLFKSGIVASPPGAAYATVLFGYSDSAWIGGVVYDDVFFG